MLSDENEVRRQFPGRIGKRLSLALALGYGLVLLVGAVSLLSAYSIYRSTTEVQEQTRHIEVTDGIHVALHHVAAAIRDALIRGEVREPSFYADLVGTVRLRMAQYEELERQAGNFPEREKELQAYRQTRETVSALIFLSEEIVGAVAGGTPTSGSDLERLSLLIQTMPLQASAMNEIHQIKIKRLIESSQDRMRLIAALYLAFLILGSLLLASASRLVRRAVVLPLKEMGASALAIARGDFGQRVKVASSDEIGQLAHSFNVMARQLSEHERQLRAVNQRLERKVREAEVLYRMGTEISALLRLTPVIESTLAHTRRLTGADLVGLALADGETGDVVWRGLGPAGQAPGQIRLKSGEGLAGRVLSEGQPLVIEEAAEIVPGGGLDPFLTSYEVASAAAVPLRRGKDVIGVLLASYRAPRRFDDDYLVLLSSVAHLAAVAIENAQLYAQAQTAAVLEERERLAREMHDGLAQALGVILVKARADDMSERHALTEIEGIAHKAYQEVRQAIFGLRMMVTRQLGLIPTLGEYLHDFSLGSGLPVDLRVEGEGEVRVAPDAEIQLVRILQEALANSRKHSSATRAWVTVVTGTDHLEVEVGDDGRGFDPTVASAGGRRGFGLQTMRERARSVGGDLQIHSAPGRGTKVRIRLPLNR
ncbi:MAG: ATP-binding protein [Candidatus Methylomirabilales bacterium]